MEPTVGDRQQDGIELRQIGLTLWRRKWVVVAILALVLACGYVGIKFLTPQYTAQSVVLLQVRQNNVIDLQAISAGLSNDASMIRSEVDVLKSRSMGERVVRKLDLINDPEFNPVRRPAQTNLAWRLVTITGLRDSLPDAIRRRIEPATIPADLYSPEGQLYITISAVLKQLSVINDGKSYTITISFDSPDAAKAARIANAFSDGYLDYQFEAKTGATARAASWIDDKLVDLRKRVEEADRKVQAYREANHLVALPGNSPTNSVTLSNSQIALLNDQLISARAARMQAEAAQREVSGGGRSDAAPVVNASPTVQALRAQEAAQSAQVAALASRYGQNYPQLVDARAQLAGIQARLNQEVGRTVTGLSTAVAQARAQEAQLEAKMRETISTNDSGGRANIQLLQLISEAEAARAVFETFLKGSGSANAQMNAPVPDARILSKAETPVWPSFPQPAIILGLVGIVGLIAAVTVAFALDRADTTLRSPDDLEALLGLPVLGMVPKVRAGRRQNLSLDALQRPDSPLAASLRTVRTRVVRQAMGQTVVPHHATKTIMVTSSVPGEGKTSFALALGRLTAAAGTRVLLIEAEMWRPSIARELGMQSDYGLTEVMTGRARVEEVRQIDKRSNLHVIVAGSRHADPTELLISRGLEAVLAEVANDYDLILIDTPPITAVPDALIVAEGVDAALVAVRWGKTPRAVVEDTVKQLFDVGVPISGTVFLQVDMHKYASYGYGKHPSHYARGYLT